MESPYHSPSKYLCAREGFDTHTTGSGSDDRGDVGRAWLFVEDGMTVTLVYMFIKSKRPLVCRSPSDLDPEELDVLGLDYLYIPEETWGEGWAAFSMDYLLGYI